MINTINPFVKQISGWKVWTLLVWKETIKNNKGTQRF